MTIAAIIQNCREDILSDDQFPYVWDDAKLTRYCMEAIKEACKASPLIKRTTSIAVWNGVSDYALPSTTRQIFTVKFIDIDKPLDQKTDAELCLLYGSSWRAKTGTPTHYVRVGNTLTLFPAPIANNELRVYASSLPDRTFDVDLDINEDHHVFFGYYIAYKAYNINTKTSMDSKGDGQQHQAMDWLAMFDAHFGVRKSEKYYRFSQDTPMYGSVIGGRMA